MIKQFRIAFGLKPGSSILTFRARHVPNAPEACLEARWRDYFFSKWTGLFPCKCIPLIEQGRNLVVFFWKMHMFLSKWLSGRFSQKNPTNFKPCSIKGIHFQGESPAHLENRQSRHLASKQASGAFATCRARKVSMDEPVFSPNAMRKCLIINLNV